MSRRISHERLRALETELAPRDRAVIAMVARLQLVSGQQLRRVLWPEAGEAAERAARRAIDRLVCWRVLARLERRVGGLGRGSASWTLALDTAGQRLVAGGTFPGARRPHLPRPAMWQHALLVSETYVRLIEATRGTEVTVADWQGEPTCWRQYSGPHGEAATLKPDGFALLRGPGYADLWFVEIDNATQSRPVITRKLLNYRRYAATGQEQQRHGVFPRVAFLTTTPERAAVLVDLVAAQPEEYWPLFAVGLVSEAGRLLTGTWEAA